MLIVYYQQVQHSLVNLEPLIFVLVYLNSEQLLNYDNEAQEGIEKMAQDLNYDWSRLEMI